MAAVIGIIAYTIYLLSPVVSRMTIEIGSEVPTMEDFLKIPDDTVMCLTDLSSIDTMELGEIEVKFFKEYEEYSTLLRIVDSKKPEGTPVVLTGYVGEEKEITDFVKNIKDDTPVTISYAKEYDPTKEGLQVVSIKLTDASGNVTKIKSTISLERDTTPPTIEVADELMSKLGNGISYKSDLVVFDNVTPANDIKVSIDNSAVDIRAEGTYSVIYTAADLAGNIATKEVFVTVYADTYTSGEVYAIADKILDTILQDTMTIEEKAEAIYNWCRNQISYSELVEHETWLQGAYQGMVKQTGDCYTYACTAKVLLTRGGINNLDIQRVPGEIRHYWNLVNLGDGWYHFDTTRRADGTVFFMWTDEELMEYSKENNHEYEYDSSLYPDIE